MRHHPLNQTTDNMHIGQKIQQVLKDEHVNVTWLATQVPCDRSNIYNIFRRRDVSTEVLHRLAVLTGHDFFADLSEELHDELAAIAREKLTRRRRK